MCRKTDAGLTWRAAAARRLKRWGGPDLNALRCVWCVWCVWCVVPRERKRETRASEHSRSRCGFLPGGVVSLDKVCEGAHAWAGLAQIPIEAKLAFLAVRRGACAGTRLVGSRTGARDADASLRRAGALGSSPRLSRHVTVQ